MGPEIKRLAKQYPIITIIGPRQSGKTTMSRDLFPDYEYVSLENLDVRQFAQEDPHGFLAQYSSQCILDEIQRCPDLISYLQTHVDASQKMGQYILTGSQQLLLSQQISQSLAGRTAIITLLPFSYKEVYTKSTPTIDKLLFTGFYPRIFDKNLNANEHSQFYIKTYLERDVRELLAVKNMRQFEIFIKLCASYTGQQINLSEFGNQIGVDHKTINSWLSVLETSYIISLVQPHSNNLKKRLVKRPKLYFLDTGLACALLGIMNKEQVNSHPLKGALFETFVIADYLKQRFNKIQDNNLYYFRDNVGNEVDMVLDFGSYQDIVEIKSGQTVTETHFKGIKFYRKHNPDCKNATILYGGKESRKQNNINILGYQNIFKIY